MDLVHPVKSLPANVFVEVDGERGPAIDSLKRAVLTFQVDADIPVSVCSLDDRCLHIRAKMVAQRNKSILVQLNAEARDRVVGEEAVAGVNATRGPSRGSAVQTPQKRK